MAPLLSVTVIWKVRVSPASFAGLASKVVGAAFGLLRITALPPVCVQAKVVMVPSASLLSVAFKVTVASAATLRSFQALAKGGHWQ